MEQSTNQLIFLVSSPRSGSTLLQNVLSNNPYVATANEPWLLLHFCGLKQPDLLKASFSYEQAHEATTAFLASTGQQESFYANLRDFLFKTYASIDNSADTRFILDKTPRYYEILPLIRQIFPEAKIILLKRNPMAVLHSIIETWHKKNIPQLYSFKRDLLNAPFLMHDFILNHSDRNTMVITYEALIDEPENEVAKLYNWLGIEFHEGVLNFASNTKTDGIFGDKSRKLKKGEVVKNNEKWQEKFRDSSWKNFFLGYLDYLGADFLEAYGYPAGFSGKKTRAFDTYRYISEKDVANQVSIGNPLTYLYFRSLYQLYALR